MGKMIVSAAFNKIYHVLPTHMVSRSFKKDKDSDNLNFHDSIFCTEYHETLNTKTAQALV